MLTVKCPRCLHDMCYDPRISQSSPTITEKKKRCVYCGMTFSVHSDILHTRVRAIGKINNPNQPFLSASEC